MKASPLYIRESRDGKDTLCTFVEDCSLRVGRHSSLFWICPLSHSVVRFEQSQDIAQGTLSTYSSMLACSVRCVGLPFHDAVRSFFRWFTKSPKIWITSGLRQGFDVTANRSHVAVTCVSTAQSPCLEDKAICFIYVPRRQVCGNRLSSLYTFFEIRL